MPKKLNSTIQEIENWVKENREPIDFTVPVDSPMVNFYRDKCIFLTGGTGFLGQLFVEKLLRTGVKRIYLLSRAKKGKSTKERLKETFSSHVFSRLSFDDPFYMDRVHPIEGDLQKLQLGISADDRQTIIDNVQIVLHSAADVRFDETLQNLLLINLRGTREILQLAEQINNLQIFIHISTAYSHCPRPNIEERFYEIPMTPYQMLELAERLQGRDQEEVEIITDQLINPWPNTYTYTKALTEELVRGFRSKFTIAVIRPTIIIATHADPIPGWINNIYGLTGVLVSTGMGFQRILPFKSDMIGDIVCADFVVNSTLAGAWASFEEKKDVIYPIAGETEDPKIYTISSYQDSPVTYGEITRITKEAFYKHPTDKVLWIPCVNVTDFAILEFLYTVLYHIIPSILFDTAFWVWGTKVRLMPMYRKVQKFMQANTYFMSRQWIFDNNVMKSVYDKMTPDDKRFFPGDVRTYNFNEYSTLYLMGMRAYIMKDIVYSKQRAINKVRLLRFAHAIVLLVLYSTYAAILYGIGRFYGFDWEWASSYVCKVPYATC